MFNDLLHRIDYERALIKFFRDFIVLAAGSAALFGADMHAFWGAIGLAATTAAYRVGRDILGFPADGDRVTPTPPPSA